MDKLREYLCFKTSSTSSVLFPNARIFPKFPSWLWLKPKALLERPGSPGPSHATFGAKPVSNGKGLVSLHKDMELCAGYADIEIMWKMIHSTCSNDAHRRSSTRSCRKHRYLVFCFRSS